MVGFVTRGVIGAGVFCVLVFLMYQLMYGKMGRKDR
jgi:hypothetical protein